MPFSTTLFPSKKPRFRPKKNVHFRTALFRKRTFYQTKKYTHRAQILICQAKKAYGIRLAFLIGFFGAKPKNKTIIKPFVALYKHTHTNNNNTKQENKI